MSPYERKYVSGAVPGNITLLTVILVGVAVVNSATLGYDSSVMNGLLILPSYSEYFNLNTATTGLNTAASWMGNIIGAFFMQPIPDYLGRKKAIFVACCITLVGIVLQAAAQNIGMFIVARIIIGIGAAIANASAPILLGELLPPRSRGRVLGIFFSCYYVGSLLSAIINYGSQNIQSTWSWRLPSLLQCLPSFLALSLLPLVPESPRWLIAKNRYDEALEVLIVMQGRANENVDAAKTALADIRSAMEREAAMFPRNPWREVFATKGNRKRLMVLAAFGCMINSWGNFIISYYLTKILDQAGIKDTVTQTQINVILSCWSFVVAIFGSFMLDVLGRRKQTMTGAIGMIITLFITGGLIKLYGESSNTSAIYGTIAVIFLFQGFYAFSITPMTSLYATEVSQFKLRSVGIAVFRFFDSSIGLAFSFAMSYAMANLGWKFYLINASWNIIYLVIIYTTFVETKGLKLEEIAAKFDGPLVLEADCENYETEVVSDGEKNTMRTPSEREV